MKFKKNQKSFSDGLIDSLREMVEAIVEIELLKQNRAMAMGYLLREELKEQKEKKKTRKRNPVIQGILDDFHSKQYEQTKDIQTQNQ